MRSLIVVLLVLMVGIGCHEVTAAPVETGVAFRLDPQTCFDMGTPHLGVRLFLDGTQRAVDTLSIGEVSKAVPATLGPHTAQAQEGDHYGYPGYVWPAQAVVVQSGQVVTVLLRC